MPCKTFQDAQVDSRQAFASVNPHQQANAHLQ